MRVLGNFTVLRDREAVPPSAFGGSLARRLFRMLLVERGTVVPRDVLVDALWEDRPPADPAANLNVLANRARRALGETGLIVTAEHGYLLAGGAACNVDAETFSHRVAAGLARAAEGRPAAALRQLEAALADWADPLPEDTYQRWAASYRQRLHREHDEALTVAAEVALALRDHHRACALASEAAANQPLSEAAHLLLVRAVAASGDIAGALSAYAAFRGRLAEELGLDPSPQAEDLHLRLLQGEPLPAPTAGPVVGRDASAPLGGTAFVGRHDVTQEILAALTREPPGAAIVWGYAGAGKSRLLDEVVLRLDVPALRARAYLAEQERPWGLARDLLREALELAPDAPGGLPNRIADALGDIVPEIADTPRTVPDGDARRALAAEGGLRLLQQATTHGAVLVCDDLQWADPSSLSLLGVIRARLPGAGLLVACRRGTIEGRVEDFLTELAGRPDATSIDLQPLDVAAITDLVDGPDAVDALADHTDGTPMAIEEVLRALVRDGRARLLGTGRWRVRGTGSRDAVRAAAETGQRRAIGLRVAQQPAPQRALLALLALLAREVPAGLVASAAGTSERQALDGLRALAVVDLTRVSDRGWAVSHDLIGDVVVERLAPAERAHLHGLISQALDGDRADQGELARHRAGAGDPHGAAAAYARAAAERLTRGADREAARLVEAGLAVPGTDTARAVLLRNRAEVRARAGDLAGASDDLHEALGHAVAGPERARILARMTLLATAAEDLDRARELAETAVIEAGQEPSARAVALSAAAIVDMNTGETARADDRTAEARRIYTELGDAHGVADIIDSRAMATFLHGTITDAVVAFDRAARLFGDLGELLRVVTPRSTRGHALVFAGDAANGLTDTERALELTLELGYPEGETYCRWHRSEALTALGRTADAIACAEEAVALAERIGHRGWKAMALRALGIARRSADDLTGAAAAFTESLAIGEGVELFTSWACAQLAMVRTCEGSFDEAQALASRALAEGPSLAGYEARLAQAELLAARRHADAREVAVQALQLARQGGHHASAQRLAELAGARRAPDGR